MTDHRCWLEFKADHSLQSKVKRGWYTDNDVVQLPVSSFPSPANGYWPGILKSWCRERGIKLKVDNLTVSARVKKAQILDFIEYVYGNDPSYNDPTKMLMWKGKAYLAHSLIDLKAFVAQELKPRLWYELFADEY